MINMILASTLTMLVVYMQSFVSFDMVGVATLFMVFTIFFDTLDEEK